MSIVIAHARFQDAYTTPRMSPEHQQAIAISGQCQSIGLI